MTNLVYFLTTLSLVPNFENFILILIKELIYHGNRRTFRSAFHDSVLNSHSELLFAFTDMNVWWIMVKSIDINKKTLDDYYTAHKILIGRCKGTIFGAKNKMFDIREGS